MRASRGSATSATATSAAATSAAATSGVDEDEEWWPGRVLGVHSQGAHAGLVDVLYDDGALQPNLTLTLTQP